MRSSPDAIVLMTVSEAFLIFVDDILSLYLLASPYSCTGTHSYCRSVSTCFPGRLPWYRTIEVSWWNYWKSVNPRRHVVASFKILFLLKLCTWIMMKMCFITLSLWSGRGVCSLGDDAALWLSILLPLHRDVLIVLRKLWTYHFLFSP
jgi:hypothetical protein